MSPTSDVIYAISAIAGLAMVVVSEYLYRRAPFRSLHIWYLSNIGFLSVEWFLVAFDLQNALLEIGPCMAWNIYRLATDDWWRRKRKKIAEKLRGYKHKAKLAALRVFRPPKVLPAPT